ncbi:BQ5605_C055g12648 [Microbotryum silenes-dioicae]|uniref:BQ5605_C055g12648 protein n=1 Tax=Microbotryum silenes-dioicae TaxID=796604 RepID=A0A2X0MNM3_9BASI|nr:BQ5605_C055g12648 [Microbotryum silenes-dioicae]
MWAKSCCSLSAPVTVIDTTGLDFIRLDFGKASSRSDMPDRPTASRERPARPGRVVLWLIRLGVGVTGVRADELGRCVGSDWVVAGVGGASEDETRRIDSDCAWAGGAALDWRWSDSVFS